MVANARFQVGPERLAVGAVEQARDLLQTIDVPLEMASPLQPRPYVGEGSNMCCSCLGTRAP